MEWLFAMIFQFCSCQASKTGFLHITSIRSWIILRISENQKFWWNSFKWFLELHLSGWILNSESLFWNSNRFDADDLYFESNGFTTVNLMFWIKQIPYFESNGFNTWNQTDTEQVLQRVTHSHYCMQMREKLQKQKVCLSKLWKQCASVTDQRNRHTQCIPHNTYLWLKVKPATAEKKHDEIGKGAREQAWCDLKCTHYHHPSRLPPHSLPRFTSTIISLFASSSFSS